MPDEEWSLSGILFFNKKAFVMDKPDSVFLPQSWISIIDLDLALLPRF
jgi:hypothetical protein